MFFGNKHTAWWKAGAVALLLILLGITLLLGERFTESRAGGDQAPVVEVGQTVNTGEGGASSNGTEATEPTKPQEPEILSEHYDVALIGSEVEGLYLARSAADLGLKVIVLDPREKPGGQLLLGEMLFLDETRDDDYRSLVQGEAKKLFDGFRNGTIRKLPEFQKVYDDLIKDIPIESGIQIASVRKEEGKQAVKSIDIVTKEGVSRRIEASYWVENSDYAALVSQLDGVTRLPGLEKFYGQSEIEYMSAGMMLKFKNVDWKKFTTHFHSISAEERSKQYGYGVVNESFIVGLTGVTNKYKATNDRVFLRGLNAVYQRDGEVIINAFLIYTVDPSKPESIAEALELGRKETPLIRDHFRKHIVGWENAEVNGYPEYLYIREYNHYETEYVLQVSDMLGGAMFADNVSIGGYPLDLQGTSANKWGIEMGRPDKYGMPLRSFLLKDYENVIMAGKNVGASAIAYGSARIQPNTMAAAESIGVILGQIHGKKKLHEVTDEDMTEFHKLLEEKYRIKLTGTKANNKIAGWTDEEIRKLNSGEITYPAYIKTRKAK
jgi:hypothetical protein